MSQFVAALFPGQGAYYRGALGSLTESYPQISRVYGEIDDVARTLLGRPVSPQLIGEDARDLEALVHEDPVALQLAIFGTSVAVYQILRSHGMRPDVLLGHSLGEISSLVAAGAWTVTQGAEIVCHRSLALESHAERDAVMVAVGVDTDRAGHLLGLLGSGVISVENHQGQTVLTLPDAYLPELTEIARTLRVQCRALAAPYPFHSPWLAAASAAFRAELGDRFPQAELQCPVYSAIERRHYTDEDHLADLITSHLTRPVHFGEAVLTLADAGTEAFVECGALSGLTGIVHKILEERAHLALAPLRPDPDETISLATSLAELAGRGVVQEPSGEVNLQEVLLPEVPTERFAMFWTARGADLVGEVRSAYSDWERLVADTWEAPPATRPAQPPVLTDRQVGGPATDRAGVLATVVDLYATALEYPPEVLEEDTDLESELGVDSVKQTELLARVAEHYGMPPRPDGFRAADYGTLSRVVDLVLEHTGRSRSTEDAAGVAAVPEPTGSARNRAEVLATVVDLYATALEYPPEVLEEDTDLESELGVDSVKQTELLARVAEHYGMPPRPDGFRAADYGTLSRVVDLVLEQAPVVAR